MSDKGAGKLRPRRLYGTQTVRCALCSEVIVEEEALYKRGRWEHGYDHYGARLCPRRYEDENEDELD